MNKFPWLNTPQLRKFMRNVTAVAKQYRVPCLMPEHLFMELSRYDDIQAHIVPSQLAALREAVDQYLVKCGKDKPELSETPEMNTRFHDRFWGNADRLRGGEEIPQPLHLIAALFEEEDCFIEYQLLARGFKQRDFLPQPEGKPVRRTVRRRKSAEEREIEAILPLSNRSAGEEDAPAFTRNLVEAAKAGKLTPAIGREREIEAVMRVLCRRKKCCPVLVGDPGVGKTAVVEGLACRIAAGDVPRSMAKLRIHSLNLGDLVAGATYFGEFEERLRDLLNGVLGNPEAILFIDEIHMLTRAGTGNSRDTMSAGNILKPYLADGSLRCIGATTHEEFRQHIAVDKALERRFRTIRVEEPGRDECLEILRKAAVSYEKFHDVLFDDVSLVRAVDLSIRFLPERRLPDKAIDLLDEAGADYRMRDGVLEEESSMPIFPNDIDAALCRLAGFSALPEAAVNDVSDLGALRQLDSRLNELVFGQREAISTLVRAVKLAQCGLLPERRGTLGNFFFTGPTGVGKTEIARSLAHELGLELLRFDMSEYADATTVSRFVGSAPGLVGFDQGGLLVNAIRKTPHAVLLLDEIEKAHPAIHNLLLQIMDHGALTDSAGNSADFRQLYLIMTGNVGSSRQDGVAARLGFGDDSGERGREVADQALKRGFSPEFRSRLTAQIRFNPLDREAFGRIVDRKFAELAERAAKNGITLLSTPGARKELIDRAIARDQGGRAVTTLLEEEVASPLADLLISGAADAEVRVCLRNGAFELHSR